MTPANAAQILKAFARRRALPLKTADDYLRLIEHYAAETGRYLPGGSKRLIGMDGVQ